MRSLLILSLAAAVNAADYTLPSTWDSVKGNPLQADGKPLWRADQVWPADPMGAGNYRPMPWKAESKAWEATENNQGGNPRLEGRGGSAVLNCAGPWDGVPGMKICALVFIAPKDGVSTVTGSAVPNRWTGDWPNEMAVVKIANDKKVSGIASLEFARDGSNRKTVDLGKVKATLKTGDQLVFVPTDIPYNTGVMIELKGLVISGP